ncbi:hypothetical protein HN014_19010 [Aquimarina sp. TRL1]|uniref:kelch repeat-containing protein n=1 Tax=Aquimarina sp. (strain TRL1) TaxID=2736252 RepID=UPI00158E0975|nr:kelch repeat-containing protein [Aquimarina sp. TRL1]QKX06919.1 hypothetical protein HN014_19010 [Aquimarina sp. TRL1]
MHTIKPLFILALTIHFFIACTNDDDRDKTNKTVDISLTITKETQQDQIGDFAENTMVIFDDKVWSVGGVSSYAAGHLTPMIWNSNDGVTWSSVISNDAFKRRKSTLTVFNNELFLIGGSNESGALYNTILKTSDGITWSEVDTADSSTEFTIGYKHRSFVFNDMLYIVTTLHHDGTDVVAVFNSPNGANWSTVTLNAFPYREDCDIVLFHNKLYAIGGVTTGPTFYNSIYESTDGISWSEVNTSSSVFSGRWNHTATVYNNKVWLIGGQNTTSIALTDIWYSNDMINWNLYDGFTADALGLSHHAALNYKDAIWLFGGYLETEPGGTTAVTGQIIRIKED